MKVFSRQNKSFFLSLFFLSIIYFFLRIPNLTAQPIFADEAIYIRWAQVMKAEPTLRFLPLSDGKTPLFMWMMIPLFKIFDDPLFAGRILSVFAGYFTFLGAIALGWRFFSKSVALWSGLLIVITPTILFFDRMALVDSMLAAFSIWSLFLGLLLIKYQRIDLSFILGFVLGGGWLTKTPGFFNLLVLPTTLLFFNWKDRGKYSLIKQLGLFTIALLIAFAMYNALRLGPGFSSLTSRNQDYIFSPTILLTRPLDPFIPHFNDLVDWLPKMLTVPILALIICATCLTILRFNETKFLSSGNKVALVILAWAAIPLLIEMALLRTFTARYILFSFPPLLVLAGWSISEIISRFRFKKILMTCLVLLIILPQAIYVNYFYIFDVLNAPLPKEERLGYLEGWTAGYGLREIAKYLEEESNKFSPIIVGTEGAFGTLPDGLQIYLEKNGLGPLPTQKIEVIGEGDQVSPKLREAAKKNSTYFVANRSKLSSMPSNVDLIMEFPKVAVYKTPPGSTILFKVNPEENVSSVSANLR